MKVEIDLPKQELVLRDGTRILKKYSVSTAKRGAGEKNGSFCTPRGRHIVRAKLGAGQPVGTVFVRRRPTGEVWTPALLERARCCGGCLHCRSWSDFHWCVGW